MQSRGYSGHIAHVHERPLSPIAWTALVIGVALFVGFEFSAHLWLPKA
jgi:hypothetical protein